METPVQPGFRVVRGPDWAYKNQDGGKGHAGTVLVMHDERKPYFPKHTVLIQWDNGDKGLYRVGYDQAFDLRIIETANTVCHTKIWCDGCNANEIKGMRWRCADCFNFDLCMTCYMNNKHDLDHVFIRVLSSHNTSKGAKMLPRSSSPRIALRGSFPGAKVVRHPQGYMNLGSDKQLGKVVRHGQTLEDKVWGQVPVEFSSTTERVGITKIICTLPGSGGYVYEGHLPNLGDLELVNEGDKVFVTATPTELEKLHKRRGLWEPDMAKTFRRKGFVNCRTNAGDFKVTFIDTQESFTMNSAALRKLHHLGPGQLVRISDDIEMVKILQFGHGGWTAAMKKEIGGVGKVVMVDGLDIHVKTKDNHKFIFNSANLTPTIYHVLEPEEKSMEEAFRKFTNFVVEPEVNIKKAVDSGDIGAMESMLKKQPELIHAPVHVLGHGMPLLSFTAAYGKADMVKFLVEKGAFIESHDKHGWTPLFHATIKNKPKNVKYLLEQGADVNASNHQSYTSLTMACTRGLSECARYLLMYGSDVNHMGEAGITPAMQSVDSGNGGIVDLIMECKDADLKRVSESHLSAMHVAAAMNNTHAVAKLLDRLPRQVEVPTCVGRTPIFSAVENGHLKTTELLIKRGRCNLNVLEDTVGMTPLLEAISGRQFHLVEILVKNGADPNIPSLHGNTSLQVALNVISDTPMHWEHEEPYMAEMKKKWGHLGIKTNADALLAFLVTHGGDLNAHNCDKMTLREVLHTAQDPILPALTQIQALTGKDIARQQSIANRPLRNVTKKTRECEVSSVSCLMKPSPVGTASKKQSARNFSYTCKLSTGRPQKFWRRRSKNVRQRASGDSSAQESKEQTSDTGDLHQLRAKLQQKDEELKTLWSRVKTLEHLVKRKISFTCGHNVIRSIADLFPKCPLCREPITAAVDLQ